MAKNNSGKIINMASIGGKGSNTGDDVANIGDFSGLGGSPRNITGQSLNVDGGLIWD